MAGYIGLSEDCAGMKCSLYIDLDTCFLILYNISTFLYEAVI